MKIKKLGNIYSLLSNDLGIDLGTANTLVYARNRGIIINEPTVVAVNKKTGRVVAVGSQAKVMLGRTPQHIEAIRPLVEGVISDFEVTQEMISYFIAKAEEGSKKLFGPRIVIGVPSGVTNVESRAVRDVALNSGAREVHIIEQPMAAAIGMKIPIKDPSGNIVLDIGGGTSDIAVISLGGIVRAKNLRVAGDHLNNDIISYVRNEFKILIGEKTAESIKLAIGSALPTGESLEMVIKGRDLITGLPREVIITEADVREAIGNSLLSIVESLREVLETTPPELISDIMQKGLYLSGGGALLRNIGDLISSDLKIPVHIPDDPLTAVARGTGYILEYFEDHEDVLLRNEDDLPPN